MRRMWMICTVLALTCACVCQQRNTPLEVTEEVVATPVTQEENAQPAPKEDSSVAVQTPAAQPVAPTPSVTTPSKSVTKETTKAVSTLPASMQAEKSAAPEPEVFDTAAAEKLIKAKRAAQTLKSPQPDTAVFKGEELIPLGNRQLGPLSYEPVTQTKTEAPWSQEELKYGVYYSFVKAGTAYIKNRGLTTVNGRKSYLIQTTAFSASVIDSVFKVRDVNYSWIDAQNFYSLGYTQSLREGNYLRDEWITFDPANKRYYGEVKKKKGTRTITGEMSMPVLDILSALYFVRAQKLQVGKNIVFDIINREEQYPLIVKVLKKETIKTAAGKFNCVVVEPQFRGEGIFVVKGKSLKVWLTDDEYKMPVKMETEVFIGSVSAELLEYKRN